MEILKGDIIEKACLGEFDVLIYPCTCFHLPTNLQGKKIRDTFTQARLLDKQTSKGDHNKLGCYSRAIIDLREFDYKLNKKLMVVNAYIYYSNRKPLFEYKYLENILKLIKEKYTGKSIALPIIGYGNKDISQDRIFQIIEKELENEKVFIVVNAE